MWNGERIVAGSKPAATRLGRQIGMWPPFTTTAIVFSRMPMKARLRPGCVRLTQRPTSSRPNDVAKSGSRSVSAIWMPAPIAHSVANRMTTATNRMPTQRSRTWARFEMWPPASRPMMSPAMIPAISMASRCHGRSRA